MSTSKSITEAAQGCIKGLTECLSVAALMENEWAENRLADMNLWISGTGACAKGRASLDSRLATRPEAREVIMDLLYLLGMVIDQCRSMDHVQASLHSDPYEEPSPQPRDESDARRPFSPWSNHSISDDQSEIADNADDMKLTPTSPLRESMFNVESMIDQLARIAVAIRRSGRHSRLQKADQRFNAGEHQELEEHLTFMLLTRLKASPQHPDSSELTEVQSRLIRCNLKRRNRFIYGQRHSKLLGPAFMHRADQDPAMDQGDPGREEPAGDHQIPGQPNEEVNPTGGTVQTDTTASAVSESFMTPSSEPPVPAASTIMSSTVIDLDYPRPPRIEEDAHVFRCPCCCEVLPVTMGDWNRWRKHISDDLCPYTCVLPSCDQPDVLFSTKELWRQHVLKDHTSLEYWICFACGDGTQFRSERAFAEHTKSKHVESIPPNQVPMLVDICKNSTPTEIRCCPLCNWQEEEGVEVEKDVLLSHIAKEIHSFSLLALPWADDNGQESDERIDYSSARVHEWLVENHIQENPDQERPPREMKLHTSSYFQQNPYFAGISKGSSSSDISSGESRALSLESLDSPKAEDFTVGIVCALSFELLAVRALFDEPYPEIPLPAEDSNQYALGRIWRHKVVTTCVGTNSGSIALANLSGSFPSVKFCLFVGIGGGVPSSRNDIRLGDVVVSRSTSQHSGVMQYEVDKTWGKGGLLHTGSPHGPPPAVLTALSKLKAESILREYPLREHVERIVAFNKDYRYPGPENDRLFSSLYTHDPSHTTCDSCSVDHILLRARRSNDQPEVHYGLIASGRTVTKDAELRDKWSMEKNIMCFEMEGTGGVIGVPCLFIRGICDYCDSHKNQQFQKYAAATAASFAKILLSYVKDGDDTFGMV